MAKIDLHPKALAQPITVGQAFVGLTDDINTRVAPKPDSKTLIQMMAVLPGNRCQLHHSHLRLSHNNVAPTVDRGGGAGEWHIWHPKDMRPITRAEVKRLGSFPDKFYFPGHFSKAFSRIGNSVPPLFMRAIADNIKSIMFGGQPLVINSKVDYPALLDEAWQQHLAPRDDDAPTVISTFAGGGGSSLGYSMAGYRELLAVEWDDHAVETFRANFPDVPVYHGDIAALSVDECLSLAGIAPDELDVLDGSPPCQGFSTAGKRVLDDDRNQLFKEFVRLLRGLRPKVFVMENVSGMVKGKMKLVFVEILRELKASGYQVSARLLNAKYFHVPQSRQRLIFIGVRDDLEIAPSHPPAQGRVITVGDAFGGLEDDINDRVMPGWLKKAVRLTTPGNYSTSPMVVAFARVKGNTAGAMGTKVLSLDRYSCTLPKSEIASTGIVHPNLDRYINISEAKRIGSFHDDFIIKGNRKLQWARIGNSVPPLMMRAIARHIREAVLEAQRGT